MDPHSPNYSDLTQPFQLPKLGNPYPHQMLNPIKYDQSINGGSTWLHQHQDPQQLKSPQPPLAHQNSILPTTLTTSYNDYLVKHHHQQQDWTSDSYQSIRLPHIPYISPNTRYPSADYSDPYRRTDFGHYKVCQSLLPPYKSTIEPYEDSSSSPLIAVSGEVAFSQRVPSPPNVKPIVQGQRANQDLPDTSLKVEKTSPPVQKQTHQALREALNKRGVTLPLDQWERSRSLLANQLRTDHAEGQGGSSIKTSPASSLNQQDTGAEKNSDKDSDAHKKRPQMSYMQLIQSALNSVSDKRMNLQQIYTWVETHYPFFKLYARKGWKNSVRHNLSLYDIFVREKPHPNDEWKFSYWCLRPENATNGTNSATKRDSDKDIRKDTRPRALLPGLPIVNDNYVVAIPPSMQPSGSRPLLPRSTSDTLAVIPLDYMYPISAHPLPTQTFLTTTTTASLQQQNGDANGTSPSIGSSAHSDSGYISLNGSILPVFPALSLSSSTANPSSDLYKLPDTVLVPTPRNFVKEATKRPSSSSKTNGDKKHNDKSARKDTRKSWSGQMNTSDAKATKKLKKRTKSYEPKTKIHDDPELKENIYKVMTPLHAINDALVSDLENNVSSPLRMLLQSPPHNFTSTPYKDKPISGLRVTPIKNAAPKSQSTPKMSPWRFTFFSPSGKMSSQEDMSILSSRSFNLSIPSLTPLKDRDNPSAGHDSSGNVSMNDSLGRLLSDFQYDDNLLDCGVLPMDMDMANASFSHISNLQQL